ncbi:MAG: type II toxin-antitoxin system VapC family toxin [Actinomycetota bacterium]|nr:type II toxin-antitoxin system VapC family toxin [Actinomycetota bacterium]
MLDASVALAWAFEDEADEYADAALEALSGGGAVVPGLWGYEVVNALAAGERRGRILPAESARFLTLLRDLPIELEALPFGGLSGLASLAREHRLSAYDAAYLEMAIRRGVPLATRHRRLGEAARRSGVVVFEV